MSSSTQLFAALVISLTTATACGVDSTSTTSTTQASTEGGTYVALGDSIPFGYSPLKVGLPVATMRGYVNSLGDELDARTLNFSCPGETSGSMLSPLAPDNGCRSFRAAFGLHVAYSGTQLSAGATYIATHKGVRLVTVGIGANDLLLLLQSCGGNTGCAIAGLGPVLGQLGQNLGAILYTIRATGYTGQIVIPNQYVPNADPVFGAAIAYMNGAEAQVAALFGATIANDNAAFAAASASFGGDPCAAGLLVKLPNGTCDIHPSPAGHALLEQAIAAVVP
jgi:lysophospholipase L1-like esterase